MPDQVRGRTAARLAAASRQLQEAIENAQRVRAEIERRLKSLSQSKESLSAKTRPRASPSDRKK